MRNLNKFWKTIVSVLSVALVLFQIYTTTFGAFTALVQRSVHLGFVMALCFIVKPAFKKDRDAGAVPLYDIHFAMIAVASAVYISFNSVKIAWGPLKWYDGADVFFAVATVVLILEAARRSIGWTFPVMAVALIV